MEVKLSQRNRPDRSPLLPKFLQEPNLPFQSHSFFLKTWTNAETSLRNQFRAIALRWKFQLQDISKDQLPTKHHLVGLVKEQHSTIPSTTGNPQVISERYQLQKRLQSSLNELLYYKNIITLASPRLSPARTTGFIVLVPLIVFCIRCIIGASYARVSGSLRHQSVNKAEGEHHELRNGHWRSALRDIREPDSLDSESSVDSVVSNSPSEDEQMSTEDLSHAYKNLDQDYEKFLSECGLSKWGYWRGGSSKP